VRFGIFDHLERRRDVGLDRMLGDRVELVARADELGVWGYHVAEHHQTRLCMAAAPSVYLGAVAAATRQIRIGTLVYQLPMHHPVRLIEEICLLDNLSGGRLQVGVGRGISGIEHTWWGMPDGEAEARFQETLRILAAGLTCDMLRYEGAFHRFDGLPMELTPLQRPYPPFWYAGNPEHAGAAGMHFIGRGGHHLADTVARFRAAFAAGEDGPGRYNPGLTDPMIGGVQHLVVADTDEEAERLARASWPVFQSNFVKRGLAGPGPETRRDGSLAPVPRGGPATERALDPDHAIHAGALVSGSPDTVRAHVRRSVESCDANYFVASFQWGSLTHAEAMRSLELFATEVMPAFR
jgi:alkanesulfonate monooxygenase SsuD/methylene tetrahydromethanopterin reductase-like flavin-dependent oxidoreductase (luciferase family)